MTPAGSSLVLRAFRHIHKSGSGTEILKLDESCISNPEIRNGRLDWQWPPRSNLRFRISGFEMQDSSNFKILAIGQDLIRRLY